MLSPLFGDPSRDPDPSPNTAIVPAPNVERDSYNWLDRHAAVLRSKRQIDPEIVLIGDSITHFWGGEPAAKTANGPKAYAALFAPYRVLNLGFGWDRTQNVLWRLDHGEFDGLHPRAVVINIGTNNTSETAAARANTPAEIVAGIAAICERVRAKAPSTRLILTQVFPREEAADHPRRRTIAEINRLLVEFAGKNHLDLIEIGSRLLAPDGTLPGTLMPDHCHPNEAGYQLWADALRPLLPQPPTQAARPVTARRSRRAR
ncbi:MAG: acetylhydrolase [Akkermansiaceae bacterium]|nr:acetylhydrolase [Akkermansiaceae bacterium]